MGAEAKADNEARGRALALLEATHKFPCQYTVTVIAFNRESVTEEIRRAAGRYDGSLPGHSVESGYESRESSAGKYLSHRLTVRVGNADEVLELYARLRAVEGIVTLL